MHVLTRRLLLARNALLIFILLKIDVKRFVQLLLIFKTKQIKFTFSVIVWQQLSKIMS